MATRQSSGIPGLDLAQLKLEGFKVHRISGSIKAGATAGRRDFYKIGLVTGNMRVRSGQTTIDIKGTVLFFVNPAVTHSVVVDTKKRTGWACIFTEDFITGREGTGILKSSPLFQTSDSPRIALNKEQAAFMTVIFEQMLAVHCSDYAYKADVIRHSIQLIIHEALRIQPPNNMVLYRNGASRISHLFLDLLERQFPIEQTQEPLRLRNPQDFAKSLHVHLNYLNRAVKQVTGKPISVHIAIRITAEAKALLQHTDWPVADIAYALGFEYPTYFNNYFKRMTGSSPGHYRKQKV